MTTKLLRELYQVHCNIFSDFRSGIFFKFHLIEDRIYEFDELTRRGVDLLGADSQGNIVISQGTLRRYLGEFCNEFGELDETSLGRNGLYFKVTRGPLIPSDITLSDLQ